MESSYKEIYTKKTLEQLVKSTVKEVADIVTMTMGPNGNTVILTSSYAPPYATKDGVSVIRALGFKNPVKDAIAKMMLEVAEETLNIAGDGTTTAICLAMELILEGFNQLAKGEQFVTLQKELEELEKNVLIHLDEMSETLNKEDIIDVATISANGDKKMGEVIQQAFNHSENVKVEEGISNNDSVETVSGMLLNTGYLDSAFVNIPEKDSIEYKNPIIILIEGTLNSLDAIKIPLEKPEAPIIIVADAVNPNIQNILRDNYNRGAFAIGLMKSPGFGGHRKNLMKDLEQFTGARLVKLNDTKVVYGRLDSISINKEKTTFSKKKLSAACKSYVGKLKTLYKTKKDDELLERRISNLNGSLSIIKVGGLTPVEVKEKYDRYDDAVKAVGCAIEEGIVAGGGAALLEVYTRLYECGIETKFDDCLKGPLNMINKNSDYTLHVEARDMLAEKIFDPTKVTKTAFINAMSVTKVILNTNGLILDRSLWI